jgi:hypothetical protein
MSGNVAAHLNHLPPSYDVASQSFSTPNNLNNFSDLVATPPVPDLPIYTTGQRPRTFPATRTVERQNPQEFYYELKKRGKAFAILTIITEGAYSKHMPTFVEGHPIKGRVQLILDKPDAIQSVVISVCHSFIFLISFSNEVWPLHIAINTRFLDSSLRVPIRANRCPLST